MEEDLSLSLSLEMTNAGFSIFLLTWIFVDMLNRKTQQQQPDNDDGPLLDNADDDVDPPPPPFLIKTAPWFSLVISTLNLGFGFYKFWHENLVPIKSLSLALTWFLSTIVTVYARNRVIIPRRRNWPLVLILWWVYSTSVCLFTVALYTVTRYTDLDIQISFSEANFVDITSSPFLILLCSSVFLPLFNDSGKHRDLCRPLLESEGTPTHVNGGGVGGFNTAGFFSKVTFSWLNPLFRICKLQKLESAQIPTIPDSETAETASCLLEESLRKQKMNSLSLPKALLYSVWKSLALNALFAGLNTSASYTGPLLITCFVNYLSNKDNDSSSSYRYGLVLAVLFLVAKTIESLSQRQWYFGASRLAIRIRAALMVLIYKKSLSAKLTGAGNGKIINFINVDSERVGDFCCFIHGVWLFPLQVFLALLILYWNLGAAPAIAALSTTVLVMVFNTPLANRQEKLHTKIMEARDARIKATSETLKSMRVLKLHAWESSFLDKLLRLRETERSWLSKYLYTCSAVAFLFWASPTLVSVVTFGVCIWVNTSLTAARVLSALATFRILQEPIYNLPELISMMAQTKVSLDRIQDFIKDEDQKKSISYHRGKASGIVIDICTGEYAWQVNDFNVRKPTIWIGERITIKNGDKVAICGSVGSGKSSLLCSILGEIPRINGAEIKVLGSKAFVAQSSWIQSGTVRENILFGKEMDQQFYQEVVDACALNKDFEMWGDGDLCVIGERGINLSGGQKQRIQLARAIYSDSDVYILDDPFSAVDAHTGSHLFKKCLMKLLSQKTVVYVTHQLESLDAADLILVMKNGRIVQTGKYNDLISDQNSELVRLMAAHRKSLAQVSTTRQENDTPTTSDSESGDIEETLNTFSADGGRPLERTDDDDDNNNEAESGRVNSRVYSAFVTAAYGGALVPVILLCQIFFQGLQMASNYWIAWATEVEGRATSNKELLGVFVLLSGGSSIFILGRTIFLSKIAIETSQRLFLNMIRSVFRAPISFFDLTPSSRILSRSSTDQSVVDTDIPYRLAGLAFALIQLLSVIILMSQVAWQVFLLFVAIIAISLWYQAFYITTARELARMVGIRKAPIIHHLSETIAGVETIRCFNQEHRFSSKILSLVDDYSRVAFHNTATMEWLSVRINFLFNLGFFVVLAILATLPSSSVDPSLSGLAATYGLNLNVLQAWVIWNLCNVENKMISVERILQFTRIPSEAPLLIEASRPPSDWPSKGWIEFENLHVQYSPSLPMILKGITCTVPGGKKVGVVGRTGSGKSTLIQALFRVVEPTKGCILIDGVDICRIGLHDLRSRLSIIPQDPTLFQDTLRANLDPLQEHTDHEIWEVLGKCQLDEIVRQDKRLLNTPVARDGENWSVGQRQLVCLARALLQKRSILVLDEATASVDSATDNVIQMTIREETTRSTVITVAHRIPTVIDNDLVLVLDEGRILEYHSPSELLRDHSSAFSKLVAEFSKRSCKNHYH